MSRIDIDPVEETVTHPTSADSIEDQYLTAREGINLREEAVTVKGRARQWGDVVEEFQDYIWRQYQSAETWRQDKGVNPTSHRFTEDASKDRYGRTLGVDRAACELWGSDLTTVHVVRRARPFGVHGQPQPPADHLQDLLDANEAVYRAYSRHIEDNHGLTYARLSVLEPHRNGYAHLHDGLWIEDPDELLGDVDIMPAIDSHLDGVNQARPRNHGPDAVSVRHDPRGRDGENGLDSHRENAVPESGALPRELCKYLGGLVDYDDSVNPSIPRVIQADRGPLRFYALLWATGKRQWRPDQSEFDRFVGMSQYWYDDDVEDDPEEETYPDPEDMDTGNGVERVETNPRPIDFARYQAEGNQS